MAENSANTQELVEIDFIREGVVVSKSGVLHQVVMVGGMNFALKSEEEQNAVTQAYQNFLNSLDFSIQILVHSRKINIDKYLSSLDERKEKEASPLLRDQISEYQEFIRGFIHEYAVMRKVFLVVVSFVPALNLPGKESIGRLLPFRKKPKVGPEKTDPQKEAEFKENSSQLAQRVQEVVEGLRTVGVETTVLDDDQLIELFYNFYNPETVEKEKISIPHDG